jgi:hypothetical protein
MLKPLMAVVLLGLCASLSASPSQQSIDAAMRVLANQVVAYMEEPTAGNVNAADNAASRLPAEITQDLIDIYNEVLAVYGIAPEEAAPVLQEMAGLAGEGSPLAIAASVIAPPYDACYWTEPLAGTIFGVCDTTPCCDWSACVAATNAIGETFVGKIEWAHMVEEGCSVGYEGGTCCGFEIVPNE